MLIGFYADAGSLVDGYSGPVISPSHDPLYPCLLLRRLGKRSQGHFADGIVAFAWLTYVGAIILAYGALKRYDEPVRVWLRKKFK